MCVELIPDVVEELLPSCFAGCKSLLRVTFGESSSLKRIGAGVFCFSSVSDFEFLPGDVGSVGPGCFSECPLGNFVISDSNSFFRLDGCLLLSKDERV